MVGTQANTAVGQFPFWVVKKIGEPLLTEADWNYTFPNVKFGQFVDGTGSIARDTTNLLYGGAGSCKMLTDAVNGHSAEVKYLTAPIISNGDLLAFEMKWVQAFAFGATAMDFGVEPRDNVNIVHARFRYTPTTGEWKYQDTDTSYQSFPTSIGGPLPIEKPTISATAGNIIGWARFVVDPVARTYVGFQAGGKNFGIETRDMTSLNKPMCIQGSSTAFNYLYFALVQAGGAGAEAGYTTDWCISKIPGGTYPF